MDTEKNLQSGFTTGSCAAAAAKAAAEMLLLGKKTNEVIISLPGGESKIFAVSAVSCFKPESGPVQRTVCSVIKDAGDDPDVTNGVLVYAAVSRIEEGILPEHVTDKPLFCFEEYPALFLTGGEGIGLVTKKGLSCAPGFYAINPVPRKMIAAAVAEILECAENPAGEKFLIEISIPQGKELAEKTFNPNLGIVGGISVLGTTGIVNPMSEQALLETIRLEIRVKAQEGRSVIAVAPGNYGKAFLEERLDISMDSFVKCSNNIGDTFTMLREEGIESVLFAGHAGKLIKVAGGVLNTHSKYGDRRMEIFADCAKEAGVPAGAAEKLLAMNTTEEAAEYLKRLGRMEETSAVVLKRIQKVIREHSGITPEVVLFSNSEGMLGMTAGVPELIMKLHKIKAEEK